MDTETGVQKVIQFTAPNEAFKKSIPRVFSNLQKSDYFPSVRKLVTLSNGDFATDLTDEEFASFAAMLGAVRVDRDEV